MKSNRQVALLWIGGVLMSGALTAAYALNPQPLPPGARAQREVNHAAEKDFNATPAGPAAAAGAAQKGSMAGPARGSLNGASSKAGAGAAKMETPKAVFQKADVPAVQRR